MEELYKGKVKILSEAEKEAMEASRKEELESSKELVSIEDGDMAAEEKTPEVESDLSTEE